MTANPPRLSPDSWGEHPDQGPLIGDAQRDLRATATPNGERGQGLPAEQTALIVEVCNHETGAGIIIGRTL